MAVGSEGVVGSSMDAMSLGVGALSSVDDVAACLMVPVGPTFWSSLCSG